MKGWRKRIVAAALGGLLAVTLVPAEAHAAEGLYMNAKIRGNTLTYDFGSQTLRGGRARVPGTAYTPYIYTLYAYNLSVYASAQGSGMTATLHHADSPSKRSACKWNYLGGTPSYTVLLTCHYFSP